MNARRMTQVQMDAQAEELLERCEEGDQDAVAEVVRHLGELSPRVAAEFAKNPTNDWVTHGFLTAALQHSSGRPLPLVAPVNGWSEKMPQTDGLYAYAVVRTDGSLAALASGLLRVSAVEPGMGWPCEDSVTRGDIDHPLPSLRADLRLVWMRLPMPGGSA